MSDQRKRGEGTPPSSLEHPASTPPDRLLAECRVRFSRASGPGGQNRNKVETAVVLEHLPTGVRAQASERRSQAENRQIALKRLRMELALRERRSERPEPTELWRSRCREGKIAINPEHDDLPALLAEALDSLADRGFDLASVSAVLGSTPSQLLKLIKIEPRALVLVNVERVRRGLRPLH